MSEFSFLNVAAVIVALAALFGYINHRWLGLPHAIGIVVIALLASLGAIAIDAIFPALALQGSVRAILANIDFHDVLMKGMLSFLLFAGALHVNLDDLLSRKWAIGSMATVGVLMSTFMVGFAVWGISSALGIGIPMMYCLVFGALIAPTDPVAVLGILKTVKVPESLEAKIAGESLFNDGVGLVVFIIMVAIAVGGGGHGGDSVGVLRGETGAVDARPQRVDRHEIGIGLIGHLVAHRGVHLGELRAAGDTECQPTQDQGRGQSHREARGAVRHDQVRFATIRRP